MTTTAPHPALARYLTDPLDDGDAVLLLDGRVCLELSVRRGEGPLLDEARALAAGAAATVLLAVARSGLRLRPDDVLLWAGLCAALEGTAARLLPLVVLPSAAPPRRLT